jgi:hypothetical protein
LPQKKKKTFQNTDNRKSPPPPGMPTTVEMNFEVLRPAPLPVPAEKSAENSPAAKKRSLSFQFWRDQGPML